MYCMCITTLDRIIANGKQPIVLSLNFHHTQEKNNIKFSSFIFDSAQLHFRGKSFLIAACTCPISKFEIHRLTFHKEIEYSHFHWIFCSFFCSSKICLTFANEFMTHDDVLRSLNFLQRICKAKNS